MKDNFSFKLVALTIFAGVVLGIINPGHTDETSNTVTGHTSAVTTANSGSAQ
jgi:hypothetical protein